MPREVVSKRARSTRAVLLLCFGLLASRATAGSPVTVQLHSGLSNPIYVAAGTVTINFSTILFPSGRRAVGDEEVADVLVYGTSGDFLAELPIPDASQIFQDRGGSGSVTWSNPVGQYIRISGNIDYGGYDAGGGDLPFFWFYLPQGPSIATGGDTQTPPTGSVTTTPPQPPLTTFLPPSPGQTNIHAIIISGLSDPAKVIASPNVTLTGGLVALGKGNVAGGTVPTWSPGLRILPDYGLLMGTKIPPVTPNIIDVRIVRQQVQADFPSPGRHRDD